jgi:Galactosyltransferase
MDDQINMLVVVVSCKKHSWIWPRILARGVKNLIILCGSDETRLDGQMLYLNCVDTYDGLPEKIMCAIEFILQHAAFDNVTHILKADDHDTEFTDWQIQNIPVRYKHILNTEDYIGHHILRGPYDRRSHFGKVPIESRWHDKEYPGEFVYTLYGGGTYILTRKSLIYVYKHKDEVDNHIYEDVMVALILRKYNIQPYELKY